MTRIEAKGWSIKCDCHTYITLLYDGRFVWSYDNDIAYGEDIIDAIEKRTRLKITDIPISGQIEDFNGIRFLNDRCKNGAEWLQWLAG